MPRSRVERRLELGEPPEHRSHARDRVDPLRGAGPVRGPPLGLDLRPYESLVRHAHAQAGRLGHDRVVGAPAREHRLHPDAGVLLVGHGRHDHVTPQLLGRQPPRREHARREARLHVVRAAPVEAAVAHHGLERALHALDADRVHVRVQHQRGAAAGAARHRHDARPAGRRLVHLDVEAGLAQPRGHELRDLRLPRPARHQIRIHRVDRHQRGHELLGPHGRAS